MTADPARSYGKHFRVTGAARASASTRAWARASVVPHNPVLRLARDAANQKTPPANQKGAA